MNSKDPMGEDVMVQNITSIKENSTFDDVHERGKRSGFVMAAMSHDWQTSRGKRIRRKKEDFSGS